MQSPSTSPVPQQVDSRSSLFDKLDPHLRAKINQALINRQPPTYKAAYELFKLRDRGVSFTAFYYYARRLRMETALYEAGRPTLPDGRPSHQAILDVVSERYLAAALDEEASSRALDRLSGCYRSAVRAHIAQYKLAVELETIKKKTAAREISALCDAAGAAARFHLETLRADVAGMDALPKPDEKELAPGTPK